MKQKLFYIAVIIIVLSVLYVLFRPINKSVPEIQTKTEISYSPGKTQQLYKQGKDSITTKTKSLHENIILQPPAKDSSYTFTNADSSYNLSLNLKPDTAGNLLMDYFLDIKTKDLVRIDTIFLTRTDTLKIKQTITERIEPPFYNTFLFGAVVTGSIILLLTILIR